MEIGFHLRLFKVFTHSIISVGWENAHIVYIHGMLSRKFINLVSDNVKLVSNVMILTFWLNSESFN